MGARFSTPVQTDPGAHPASCTMGTVSLPGAKSGLVVTLIPHPLLVSWSRKSSAIPLLPLWAIRPVQSLSACTRVHCTEPQCVYKGALYRASVRVKGCTVQSLSACTRVHCTEPLCLYKGALYRASVRVQGCTVQSLSACARVHCTEPQCVCKGALYRASMRVQGCTVQSLSACTRVHCTEPLCQYKSALLSHLHAGINSPQQYIKHHSTD